MIKFAPEIQSAICTMTDNGVLNGHTWQYKNGAIHWSYLDIVFYPEIEYRKDYNIFRWFWIDAWDNENDIESVFVGDNFYADFDDFSTAIYKTTISVIKKAIKMF